MIANNVKILQVGMPKSGNFWLYKTIQEMLSIKGIRCRSFIKNHPIYEEAKSWDLSNNIQAGIDMIDIERERCYYRISSVIRNPIYYLPEYVHRCTHVWTHSPACEGIEEVLKEFNKIVYIYRDPRDAAISAAKFAFTPYMQKYYPHNFTSVNDYLENNYAQILDEWKQHLVGYLQLKDQFDIHFIAYENLLEDFQSTLCGLSDYMGYDITNNEILNIYKAVNFDEMKTQNPGHVSNGKRMQWTKELSEEQKETAKEELGVLLNFLNYPLSENEFWRYPENANIFDNEDIEKIETELKYTAVEI